MVAAAAAATAAAAAPSSDFALVELAEDPPPVSQATGLGVELALVPPLAADDPPPVALLDPSAAFSADAVLSPETEVDAAAAATVCVA